MQNYLFRGFPYTKGKNSADPGQFHQKATNEDPHFFFIHRVTLHVNINNRISPLDRLVF